MYKDVVKILRQLRIPFRDPCDNSYVGDCICNPIEQPKQEIFSNFVAGQVSITVSCNLPSSQVMVMRDRMVLIHSVDYVQNGNIITFTSPLYPGQIVEVRCLPF